MTETDIGAAARAAGLQRMGMRPPLGEYLREVWRRRHFAWTLALYRIQARNSETRLGIAWSVITPILNVIVYGTIFGVIMVRSSRPENFIAYLVVGAFIFEFFGKSFNDGAKSIISNRALARSLSFPRMLLPLSVIARQLIELGPMLVIMFIILIIFGEPITWTWLLTIPILMLMTLFCTGVALISARLTVHVRDLTQVLPFITRLLFYTSGIFFSLEHVLRNQPLLLHITHYNPVQGFITLVRSVTITGVEPTMTHYIVTATSAVVALVVGVFFFWRAEERYGLD